MGSSRNADTDVGELRVAVRVVGREHEVVVAEPVDVVARRTLVGLDAQEAVRPEVLGRRPIELGRVLVADPLPVLVEAVEQPRRPSAVPFEQADAQVGEPLEHAAGRDAHGHGHDPDRLPEGVPHHEVVELERVVGPQVVLTAAVEAERDTELLARAPDRVVGGIVPRPTVDQARAA